MDSEDQGAMDQGADIESEVAALARFYGPLATPLALVDHDMVLHYANPALERASVGEVPDAVSGFLADPYVFSQYLPQIARSENHVLTGVGLRHPWGSMELHFHRLGDVRHLYVVELQSRRNVTVSFEAKGQEALARRAQMHLERVQQELGKANLELQHFAYVASHDLQAPLRGIEGFLKLLLRTEVGELSDQSRDLINHALDNSRYMQRLIVDLLRFSRLVTDQEVHRPVSLGNVFDDVQASLQARLEQESVQLDVSAELPVVSGDRKQLQMLFAELIDNAIHYRSHRPLRINVSVSEQGDHWAVDITDNGIGIDRSQQQTVFELFHRVATDRHRAGTGIGLSMCSRIAGNHHGSLWVQSTPGVGSTFTVGLPRLADTAAQSGQ